MAQVGPLGNTNTCAHSDRQEFKIWHSCQTVIYRSCITSFRRATCVTCFAYSHTHSLTHSYSLAHSPTHSLTHSSTDSLNHSLTHSFTHSFIYPLTHWLTDSLTHSLTTCIHRDHARWYLAARRLSSLSRSCTRTCSFLIALFTNIHTIHAI